MVKWMRLKVGEAITIVVLVSCETSSCGTWRKTS